ncbi:MAG: hypothetical protein KDB00_16065, partial [Planctomycetales bacterium]|nr:hypothetical protein [Planctomycetales bacterium]
SASILMVHEVGGRCHYAHYLAAELASKKSLFVCNQPTHEQSPRSIVALATLYADAWIQTHATGPRIIVAFCWGGPLAYEIARQLKSRDVFVQAVLIVESGTEAAYRHACRRNRMWDRFKGLLVRARNRCGTLGSPAGVLQLYVTLQNKLLRRGVPITADAGFQFRDDEGDPVQIRSNVQAFLEYTIQPDEIAIHLFRVRGPAGLIGTKYSDTSLGWRYVVGPKLTLHDIPGDHDTCMKPPNVSVLARSMNHVIRELESIPNSPMPRKDSLS